MTCKDCEHWYMCMDRSREYICTSFEPNKKKKGEKVNGQKNT